MAEVHGDHIVEAVVHTVSTIHPGGHAVTRLVVACPQRRRVAEAAECSACEHARGVTNGARRVFLCAVDRTERVKPEPNTVAAAMTREVVCVARDLSVETVAHAMVSKRLGGVCVVDATEKPIGMLSRADVLPVLLRRSMQRRDAIDAFDPEDGADETRETARDLMGGVPLTLTEHEPLKHAAEMFAARGIHRAPVVGLDGRVVGMLTTFDIVRALAHQTLEPSSAGA
jgi:CBS domain-containing protein